MVGLGLALAQPQRRVVVITGDGELLMGLGSLATIGASRVSNLAIAVLDNEHYGETGMQASHTALGVDLAGIAAASQFRSAATIYTGEELGAWAPRVYNEPGPLLGVIKVETNQPALRVPVRDGTYIKTRFREALLGDKAFECESDNRQSDRSRGASPASAAERAGDMCALPGLLLASTRRRARIPRRLRP